MLTSACCAASLPTSRLVFADKLLVTKRDGVPHVRCWLCADCLGTMH